jgi:DNA-binding NtrC family response regulator
MSYNILIVDDNASSIFAQKSFIQKHRSYNIFDANDKRTCLAQLKNKSINLVILDLIIPEIKGFELLEKIKEEYSNISVIILTVEYNIEKAVQAIKLKADDYIVKNQAESFLLASIDKCQKTFQDNLLKEAYIQELSPKKLDICIPDTQAVNKIFSLAKRYAKTDLPILIQGETGTGKEMMAKCIHEHSARTGPMITLDCASRSQTLLESDLFGHTKGSFTDAHTDKIGKIELAHKGTLFLDELANISADVQAKLLRVLDTKMIERIGAVEPIEVDFRLLAATNEKLLEAVEMGRFRKDLFHRINVFSIHMLPIRDDKESILFYLDYFINKFNQKYQKDFRLSPEQEHRYLEYKWPGNIRELKFEIAKEVSIYDPKNDNVIKEQQIFTLNDVQIYEKSNIEKALKVNSFNVAKTAKALSVPRSTLQYKIRKYNLG